MGLVESRWRDGRVRIGPGVFFSDDRYIELEGNPDTGYVAGQPGSVADLAAADPDWLAELDASCEWEHGDLRVIGYGGAWEGEGAVALLREGRLVWIMHLPGAEVFREVQIDGDVIDAVSEEYPFRYTWRIPVGDPFRLAVSREHL